MRLRKIKTKKGFIFAALILGLIVLIVMGTVFLFHKKPDHGITMAEAAKLVAYSGTDFNAENSAVSSQQFEKGNYWYTAYVDAVNQSGLMEIKNPVSYMKYSDVCQLAKNIGVEGEILDRLVNSRNYIPKQEFLDIFIQFLPFMKNGENIQVIEAGIAGTPKTLTKAGEWEVYTTKGTYRFTGIVMDDKIDQTVQMITCGKEILAVEESVKDEAEYKNIWIKNSEEKAVYTNVYGADRMFQIQGLSTPVENVLADIKVIHGEITAINIKTDTITGNVLAVTKEYVEVQGYGKVALDEYFMIYDIYNGFAVKSYQDIVVGYSLQDFIVAEGKICGAVISKPLNAQNIRVVIRNTGFGSIFHDTIRLTSDKDYTISFGDEMIRLAAGEVFEVSRSSEQFQNGRITVTPDTDGEITLLHITRSQGNPSYEGKMELVLAEEGLIAINDVDIEKYLKRVVPSEMPAGFPVEALKVQAVCARSYAYKHLSNSYYSQYGAHVDDSTLFQVYNNTVEYDSSNEAIQNTRGQVLTFAGEVVQTYYYSTSCGMTTDVGIWGTDPSGYPYFQSRAVSSTQKEIDLTNEENFEAFITSKDENDYDYSCALYRWEFDAQINQLSNSFNTKLYEKYLASPEKVLTLTPEGTFVSQTITTVGTITGVTVNERAAGGAIKSLTVTGTENTVRIDSESCIRGLFGMADVEMTTNTGTTKMASLPSTFCIFKPLYTQGQLTGYRIIGGGYGHGIGMSQNAVNAMVKNSMNYRQILEFFYPGTQIEN